MMVNAVNWLIEVPSTDPEDARRRKLLNILLVGVTSLTLLLGLALTISYAGALINKDILYRLGLGTLASFLGFVFIFLVNRYRSGWLASSLFLLLLTGVFAFADEPEQVVNGRSLFLFTIPILMASVILRPWASFAVAGLSSLVISVLAVTQLHQGVLSFNAIPIPTLLGLFAFALISWLSARSLENALRDLRALNRELDHRVEERTLELQEANRELAEANERLMELDRLKSKFVSMVSHELRTPLSAIQGFAEMLQAGIYGSLSDKQRDSLERIEKNAKRLMDIVNDLLDQARIEAGQLSLQQTPFSPTELVEDLQSTMGVLAEKKGLELTTDVSAEVPATLYGDVKRLNQILINLVNNAIKFTDEGGVHVQIHRPDGAYTVHWAMEISDTGSGIPKEEQGEVFAPFRRVDDSMTREHTGVGLGLSIVKQLVELMGGDITLESKLGHGSTFTVVLPLKKKEKTS